MLATGIRGSLRGATPQTPLPLMADSTAAPWCLLPPGSTGHTRPCAEAAAQAEMMCSRQLKRDGCGTAGARQPTGRVHHRGSHKCFLPPPNHMQRCRGASQEPRNAVHKYRTPVAHALACALRSTAWQPQKQPRSSRDGKVALCSVTTKGDARLHSTLCLRCWLLQPDRVILVTLRRACSPDNQCTCGLRAATACRQPLRARGTIHTPAAADALQQQQMHA